MNFSDPKEFAAGFKSWAGTMPENLTYTYEKPRSCAIAQYLASMGKTDIYVTPRSMWFNDETGPHQFDVNAQINQASYEAVDFGDLTIRLEELQATL